MQVKFRQGLISFQQSGGIPSFLSGNGSFVNLNVTPSPLIATISHGSADYLIQIDKSVEKAFGPFSGSTPTYLFVEIDELTGELKYGSSSEPVISSTEPVNASVWYDTSSKVFKNKVGARWQVSLRVYLGVIPTGTANSVSAFGIGSSVNDNTPSNPGFIILDSQLRPVRTSTGVLLTSQTPVHVKNTVGTSGLLASPPNSMIPVRAEGSIPALTAVYISGPDSVSVASTNPALDGAKWPVGIVLHALADGDVGVMVRDGELAADGFSWPETAIGKAVYCDFHGRIVTARPSGYETVRVGHVKNSNTIILEFDSETKPQLLSQSGSLIVGDEPIFAATTQNSSGEIVTSISIVPATSTAAGSMSAGQVVELATALVDLTHAKTDIINLGTSKADVAHTHQLSHVDGLVSTLEAISQNIASKMSKPVGASYGDVVIVDSTGNAASAGFSFESVSRTGHTHQVQDIANLEALLSGKANTQHTHDIGSVDGLSIILDTFAVKSHTHQISGIDGLSVALDGKAKTIHLHDMADTDGLLDALDSRALLLHTHAIQNIDGLQYALNSKADFLHSHSLSAVVGLVEALDAKANSVHLHTSEQIQDFDSASFSSLKSALVQGPYISLSEVNGKLVIGSTVDPFVVSAHVHPVSDVSGLIDILDAKASITHTHPMAGIDGLALELSQRALINHVHSLENISGLPEALTSKANASHSHLVDEITDLSLITLPDVVANNAAVGDSLVWNGTFWVNIPSAKSLGGLTDVYLSSPVSGQILRYDGSKWIASPDIAQIVTGAGFKAAPLITVNVTSNILVGSAADHGVHYRSTSASDLVVSVLPDSAFTGTQEYWQENFRPTMPAAMPNGGAMIVGNHGGGAVTFVASPGVTINTPETLTLSKLHGKVTLIKVEPNVWDLEGHLDSAGSSSGSSGGSTGGSTSYSGTAESLMLFDTYTDTANASNIVTQYGGVTLANSAAVFAGDTMSYITNSYAPLLGADDFTLEFHATPAGGGSPTWFGTRKYSPDDTYETWFVSQDGTSSWRLYVSGTYGYTAISAPYSLKMGVTQHVAYIRHGNDLMYFVDGVLKNAVTVPTGATLDVAPARNQLCFGKLFGYNTSADTSVVGELHSYRFTRSALWTANFTPPAETFA